MFWKTFFSGDRLKNFCEDLFFLFFFFGDRLKNFCEDLFFFWRALALCVLGPWPWPRAFLSLASRVSVLGKAVLGLGLGFFLCPWPRALCPRLHLCFLESIFWHFAPRHELVFYNAFSSFIATNYP